MIEDSYLQINARMAFGNGETPESTGLEIN
jgi:hypothetical protein